LAGRIGSAEELRQHRYPARKQASASDAVDAADGDDIGLDYVNDAVVADMQAVIAARVAGTESSASAATAVLIARMPG